jgi:predicted SnoaL-like aldol condensation-catalyzing enzyme
MGTDTTNATNANKALVLAGIKGVFIDRDPTVLDRLFSDDYQQHNPQIRNGTAPIKTLLGSLPSDFKYEPGLVVAEGNYVTIHDRYLGWGPKPMVAVDIFRVANGNITEHWDVMQEEVPAAQSASGNSMLTAPQGIPAGNPGSPEKTPTPVLNWETFVTPGIPIVTPDRPPAIRETYFQAMASTLIYGMRDAVLVDTFMTVKQANALTDWVSAKGKNLTTIYITHGHGDHWFGIGTLLERFPNARVAPHAFLVLKACTAVMEVELSDFARTRMAASKFPKHSRSSASCRKRQTGKIQKYVLRGTHPAIAKQ